MSDAGRKDFGDKFQEHITPDSTKSTQTKAKEGITDVGDKVARGFQPDDSKSSTQSAFDKMDRSKDREVHGSTGEGILDKTKHALGMDKH